MLFCLLVGSFAAGPAHGFFFCMSGRGGGGMRASSVGPVGWPIGMPAPAGFPIPRPSAVLLMSPVSRGYENAVRASQPELSRQNQRRTNPWRPLGADRVQVPEPEREY